MSVYACRRCKFEAAEQWEGLCPNCGGLYRARIIRSDDSSTPGVSTFAAAAELNIEHVATGIEGFDHVLSGGFVIGKSVLLGGFPNVGKTTLLSAVCAALAERRGAALYASSEEDTNGVISVAKRLGLTTDKVKVLGSQLVIERVIEYAEEMRPLPFLTVFDSIQKYSSELAGGSPGSQSQLEAVSDAINKFCRRNKRCAVGVNQMTNEGVLKGGLGATHNFDAVLVFAFPKDDDADAPAEGAVRMLVCEKNRNGGADNVKTYWRMTETGQLEHIKPCSKLLPFPKKYSKRREEGDEA
jgi:DNA repair protein RadA/Sms